MPDAMEMLAVRLPKALIRRLDAYCKQLEKAGPGLPVRRSDVVRLLITRGLDDAEKGSRGR